MTPSAYMHRINLRFTTVFAGAFLVMLSACGSPKTVSEASPIQDPALFTGTLENGVRYAVLRNQTPPETGALRVRFATGSLNELPGTGGIAHYIEHMAFNGSKNVPEGEMIKMLERHGLAFGADTNAHTSTDETVYKLNLPTVKEEVLDVAFMLMRETAENLTMDQDAIERELGIILSEKRTRDSASYRAWESRMGFLTSGSDFMTRLPIGSDESLNSINSDDFKAYYHANYHPQKTLVTFVGDVDPEVIVARIKETFGDWTSETEAAEDRAVVLGSIAPNRVAFHTEEGLLTNISFYALHPYEERADTLAYRRQRLVSSIATGLMGARMRNIYDGPQPPFIFAGMSTLSTFDLVEGVSFSGRAHRGEWKNALEGMDQELRKALEFGFTQQEYDTYIKRLDAAYEASAKGADTRTTISRTGGLVKSVLDSQANDRVFTHPRDRLTWYNKTKPSLTLKEVNAQLVKLWGNLDDASIYMESGEPIENAEPEIRRVLTASREVAVSAPESLGAEEFLYTEFGEPGKVVSETHVEDVDGYLVKFDNNVRLNFKQTDFSDDRVFVRVDVGEGSLSIPRKDEGLRRMALNLINKSGLEAHDSVELRRLLAGKLVSTDLSFREASETFYMNTVTVPKDLGTQFNVYAAKISAPAFREDVRANYIKKLQAWYPTHDTTVQGVTSRYIPRLIRNGDKRFGFGEESEFYAPTVSEIEGWLRPQLETGLIEITIIGDIDKETVIKEVARTFAALPTRKDSRNLHADMRTVKFPEGKTEPVSLPHKGDDNQSQIRVYWPAPDGIDVSNTRKMNILRAIFRNRMVEVIREDEAATYSPSVGAYSSSLFEGYGYLTTVMNVVPETIPELFVKIDEIAADFQVGNITQDEFDRAMTPIRESLDDSLKTNGYWMNVMKDAQTGGDGIDNFRSRDAEYDAMTLEDVKALAASVLNNEKAYRIQVVPATKL